MPLLTYQKSTVLNHVRTVKRFYPDGSYECPWCCAAVCFPEIQCRNPACFTNPYWKAEKLQAELDKIEARKREEERRQRDIEWSRQYREEQRKIEEETRTRVVEETRSKLREKAIRLVKNLLQARRNGRVDKEQFHYEKLVKFCQKNNVDFQNTLDGATKYLKQNSIAAHMNGLV